MKSQKIITKSNLLVIASLLTLNCSCTLNKRQLPKDGETDPQGKVTISTPPPAPVPIPTPTPTKIAEPNSTSVLTQTQNSTEDATNKSEMTDVQIPLDIEEFNHPTVPLKRQGLYRGKPVATLKKNFTGLIDLSNLAYTDSGSDYLIPYIRIENEEEVKSQSKKSSQEWSQQIVSVKLIKTKELQFSLEITYEGNEKTLKTVKLTGVPQMNERYAILTEKESDTLNVKLNSELSGELRCIDLTYRANCANYHIKLVMKKTDGEVTAEGILRTSSFDLNIEVPNSNSQDPHLSELKEEFTDFHFTNLEMQSFAIVNGRSEFSIKLISDTKKYIFISGPLLTNFGQTLTDMQLNTSYNNSSIIMNELLPQSTNTSSLLNEEDVARLVSNDGSGSLVIKLRLQNKVLKSQNDFIMHVSRLTIPTIDPTEETLYFKP